MKKSYIQDRGDEFIVYVENKDAFEAFIKKKVDYVKNNGIATGVAYCAQIIMDKVKCTDKGDKEKLDGIIAYCERILRNRKQGAGE